MKIVIAGAGSVGRLIAHEATDAGHEVSLIDSKPEAMRVASVPAAQWHLGDASELGTLAAAGADEADAVVATTGDDKANLIISLLAKTEFGVSRVIARVNHESNEWLFDESWGVDLAVSTPHMMAEIIGTAVTTGRLIRLMEFESGAHLYRGTVSDAAPATKRLLREAALPPQIAVTAVIRDGTPLVPEPDMRISADDELVFVIGSGAADALSEVAAFLG